LSLPQYQSTSPAPTYAPLPTNDGQPHSNLLLVLNTPSNLQAFTFNTATTINYMYIKWNNSDWYNAAVLGTVGGVGCLFSTINGTSYKILAPIYTDTSNASVYINIQYTSDASMYVPNISISDPNLNPGVPTIQIATGNLPQFSHDFVYISGIPYYTSTTQITFSTNSLQFTNMYPSSVNAVEFTNDANNIIYLSDTYNTIFNSPNSVLNDKASIQLTNWPQFTDPIGLPPPPTAPSGGYYPPLPPYLSVYSTLYNVSYTGGVRPGSLFTFGYFSKTVNDNIYLYPTLPNMGKTDFSTLGPSVIPNSNIIRYSVVVNQVPTPSIPADIVLTPSLPTSGSSFVPLTDSFDYNISIDDLFYSPIDDAFYQNYSNIPLASNTSSYNGLTIYMPGIMHYNSNVTVSYGTMGGIPHSYIAFYLYSSSAKTSIYVNMTGNATQYINNIYACINLSNSTQQWYSAKYAFTDPTGVGCGTGNWNPSTYIGSTTSISINLRFASGAQFTPSINNGHYCILFSVASNANINLSNIHFTQTAGYSLAR
jgi:hypothetical protein